MINSIIIELSKRKIFKLIIIHYQNLLIEIETTIEILS